ncbi:MAG: choice-of-anchor tandem repeat GloVer-containing protein [Terriglobales bacterium]
MRKIALSLAMLVLSCTLAMGQTEKVLYSFGTNPGDGEQPFGSLALDGQGNLFGITPYVGTLGGGTVFEVSPNSNGAWTETVLYNFCSIANNPPCPNGSVPNGTPVIDSKGNLYGAADSGGPPCSVYPDYGCGLIYELSPPSQPGGAWTQRVLYNFCQAQACEDGLVPNGALIFDKLGNLYGTAGSGGSGNKGIVFELSPGPGGVWTETVLYSFCSSGGACLDGLQPEQGVIFDKSGNLYGDTVAGGSTGYGVVFKLSPGTSWTESLLYTFPAQPGTYGYTVPGPMSIDPLGNLYTTATWVEERTGNLENGDLYRFGSTGNTTIYQFKNSNGNAPLDGVIVDATRRLLYGTTSQVENDSGNVFQIDAHGHETVLYVFCRQSGCADGKYPNGGLREDESGNLYGVTAEGGAYAKGVVFEITP